MDARYRKSDGSVIAVEVGCRRVSTPDGVLTYCSARDSTERKALEAALSHKRALLQALGQTSQSGYLLVQHRTDRILYVNHRFCVLWDVERLEAALAAEKLTYSQLLLAMQPLLANARAFFTSRLALEDEAQPSQQNDTIALTDQRLLRRYSTPVYADENGLLGRLYVYDEALVRDAQAN